MEKCLPKIGSEPFIETAELNSPPEELFRHFENSPEASFLNSSMETDVARFSFIGIEPFLVLTSKGKNINIRFDGHRLRFKGDPFEYLDSVIRTYRMKKLFSLPFTSGGIGYLSYDLKDVLEKLPQKAEDDLLLPDLYFVFYRAILIHDRQDPGRVKISVIGPETAGREEAKKLIDRIKRMISSPLPEGRPPKAGKKNFKPFPESNFTRPGYVKAVKKTIDYIRAGDIYQACLSQRFKTKWPYGAYELYLRLNEINPAPFSAYLNFEGAKIISSSPELFLKVSDRMIETRPMKGTRPRGKNAKEDKKLKDDLKNDPKDASELAMIVDLERNDLGKVAIPGSVKVIQHKRLETYPTVHQTISVVKGEADAGASLIDIVKAAFPGGSITGCPKIRAMEIIDELEPSKRNVYTGAIGYISFHDTMELNIAIRTMIMKGKDVYFQAGGGIVADSDPEAEYQETLHKAQALMTALTHRVCNTPDV